MNSLPTDASISPAFPHHHLEISMQDALVQEQSQPQVATVPPMPGQPWPEQGGIYAGIMRGDDNLLYHLIVANSPSSDIADLSWGSYGEKIPGCDSKWDGATNTRALQESDGTHPILQALDAAEDACAHDDWYLPSQRELALCWAVIPDAFHTDDWYWSSTQYSSNCAWYQDFEHGIQGITSKDYTGRARAVRRLIIQ